MRCLDVEWRLDVPARPDTELRSVLSFDSASISYRDFGGGGAPLVLLPGWACTQVLWDPVIPHLGAFRVVTLDYAGFGTSAAAPRQGAIEDFARDVKAVLEALDLTGVTLVGHSMGGAVALDAACLCPDRVLRVIGCDTYTYTGFYEPLDDLLVDETMVPFRADCAATVRGFMPHYLGSAIDPALAGRILDILAAADPACAVPAMECLLRWDLGASLARCPVPVATINAAAHLTADARQRYADRILIRTMDGVGHFLMVEQPAAFARAVEEIAKL